MRLPALSTFAATLLIATTALAQTAPTQISDQKLGQAAAAAKQVVVLNNSYKQKLDQASPEQKQQISNEADAAMSKAVTDQGLSVDEYVTIMQVAQNDSSVRDKLLQHMK